MCITALIGAAIGGGIGYGGQVIGNLNNGLSVDQALTHVEGAPIVAGVVAGAVGGATFGIGTAVLGTGFGAAVVSGAAAGALSGQAGLATENILTGNDVTLGLGKPEDIARDAAVGAILGGAGNKLGEVLAGEEKGGGNFAPGKLDEHFSKHAGEFGYKNADEYLQGARRLTEGGEGILEYTRPGGDRLFYDPETNEFGVLANDNQTIRTYFAPKDGMDYWLEQTGGQ